MNADRIARLLSAHADGWLEPEEWEELLELLRRDPQARAAYIEQAILSSLLFRRAQREDQLAPSPGADESAAPAGFPSISVVPAFLPSSADDSSSAGPLGFLGGAWHGSVNYLSQHPLFSGYLAATVVLGLAIFIASLVKISHPVPSAHPGDLPALAQIGMPPEGSFAQPAPLVGRITGLVDCQWAKWSVASDQWSVVNESEIPSPKSQIPNRELLVPLGAKYRLSSGLMEITYDTGAKVILQGPCTYEIESAGGGFLSFGKLTARVEGRAEGGGRKAEGEVRSKQWAVNPKSEIRNLKSELLTPPSDRGSKGERNANLALSKREKEPTTSLALRPSSGEKSEIRNPKSEIANPSPLSPLPSPLFTVRTPTAIVTDLGTEFGVEVDGSGASRAHVFQGKVELQPTQGDKGARAIQLGANESARVEIGKEGIVRVVREDGQSNPRAFARQMPRPALVKRFNTGMGLREGDPDPHWQIVAVSNDPNFKPRPAVVTAVGPEYQPNDPARWQWISIGNGPPNLPNGVTCTFRTTIEIEGTLRPDRYRSLLRLSIFINKSLKEVRVNGERLSPNKPSDNARPQANVALGGTKWRKGINYMEFDVTNEDPSRAGGTGPILLKVSWD